MKKGRVLFIIDIIVTILETIGIIFASYLIYNANKDSIPNDKILSYVAITIVLPAYRLVIPILLTIMYNKKGFLRVMRIVAIVSLNILSAIGAFYNYDYIENENSNQPHKVNANIVFGRILIVFDLLLSLVIAFFIMWGIYNWYVDVTRKLGLATILFIFFLLILISIPIIFAVFRIATAVVFLVTTNYSSKLFKKMRIAAKCVFCLFAILGLNLIIKEREELDNNSSIDISD